MGKHKRIKRQVINERARLGNGQYHKDNLEYLTNHLNLIDINNPEIVIQEPRWYVNRRLVEMCDLIVGREDETCVCLELKHAYHDAGKARRQLDHGRMFAQKQLGYAPDAIDVFLVLYKGRGEYSKVEIDK